MAGVIQFGAYAPDQADLNQGTTSMVSNVLPQSDGYGPFPSLQTLTAALPDACRGCFFAHNGDGSASIFAGTSTDLYLLDNTSFTWTKVSKSGGPYSDIAANAQWQFAQFGSIVLATHVNVPLQEYNLTSSTEFADTSGSPPQAAYLSVINQFVVLSGIVSAPYRVKWSALNDRTGWTPGLDSSDEQDLPNGGPVRGVSGGELGFILQDQAIRRMLFVPGSDTIFQIDKLHTDIGISAPYSMVVTGDFVFFLSAMGFMQMDGTSGALTPIGSEVVNRTFAANYDNSTPQLVIGCGLPDRNATAWTYKSISSGNVDAFDSMLVYNYVVQRWTPIAFSGQFISPLATIPATLEGLDAIAPTPITITGAANNGSGKIRLAVSSTASLTTGQVIQVSGVTGTTEANNQPNDGTKPSGWTITVIDGTHIDLQGSTFTHAYVSGGIIGGSIDNLSLSLDNISAVSAPKFAGVDANGKLGFFTGPNLEAIVQAPEQGAFNKRLWIPGIWPDCDAPTIFGSIGRRENLSDTPSYTVEQALNRQGFIPQRADTRYARAKLRIPAGVAWTYARGIFPEDPGVGGKR